MSVMVNSGETERDINWFPYSNELYQSLSLFISIVFGDLPLRRKLKGLLDALRHFNKRERLW
jgi:hypothetical protein